MRLVNRSVGRLSRHRRGPLVRIAALLVCLLLTGGLYAAFAPASADSELSDAALAAEGRELFLVGCAFCHGQNGQGLETVGDDVVGPTLVGVGAAAVDFQVGTGRMPLARSDTQAPRKEEAYSEEEVAALAAYVASLAPGPEVPTESDYSIERLEGEEREEAITRGSQIFLTNCTACHNFAGAGGAMPRGGYAPKIRDVDPRYIYEAMLTGPQQMPNFSNGNLPPDAKRDVIAYIATLRDEPSTGGFGLGSLGPVSEGLVAWLVGIGGLVGFTVWIAAHTARSTQDKPGTGRAKEVAAAHE